MFKKLGWFAILVAVALPAWSASRSGTIVGYVRDSAGAPQMGAVVELLPIGVALVPDAIRAFTDDRGFYSIASLLPGTYNVKVTAPSFLPTLRERIGIRADARTIVNVTMTNLFEAIQLLSTPQHADQDDWKWTLRSISNRPILRVLEDGTTAVVENANPDSLKASLAMLGGSPNEGFGSAADMNTAFSVEHQVLSTGTLRLNGNLGYASDGTVLPDAFLRTTYTGRVSDFSEPSFSLTALRLSPSDPNAMPGATLQAVSLTSSDRVVVGDRMEVSIGSQLQTIQFLRHVRAFRPFGSADFHVSPNTVVEYQYQSAVPQHELEQVSGSQFDPNSIDPSTAGPRMSISNFAPAVEHARHDEVSLSQRLGDKNSAQVAFYRDSVADPVLTGVGVFNDSSGEVLSDIYSGTFSYQGNDFSTRGLRVVLQRKLLSDLTATLDYDYGGVLDLSQPDIQLEDARNFIRTETRQAVAAKFSGTMPKSKTHWMASYRQVGGHALTPVDLFNTSPGQADPYFNLFVRQPLPTTMLGGHLELLIDIRNLLAQGYVPLLSQDGHTVYLVQSVRSVRGGVAFSF